jgi:hypothetical protein
MKYVLYMELLWGSHGVDLSSCRSFLLSSQWFSMLLEEAPRVSPELQKEAKRTQIVLERISGRRLGAQVQEVQGGGGGGREEEDEEEEEEGPVVVDAAEVEASLGRAALNEVEDMLGW